MMQTESVVCKGGAGCVSRVHMCKLVEHEMDREWIGSLVKEATHFCLNCGRSSNDPRYLCRPMMIG